MSKNTFIPTTKGLVSAHKSQDFTSDQKAQARTNIAAAASTHTHSADDIVSGALAKARQHAQTAYYDAAGTWAETQLFQKPITVRDGAGNDVFDVVTNQIRFRSASAGYLLSPGGQCLAGEDSGGFYYGSGLTTPTKAIYLGQSATSQIIANAQVMNNWTTAFNVRGVDGTGWGPITAGVITAGQVNANNVGENIRLKADGSDSLDGAVLANGLGTIYLSNWNADRGIRINADGSIATLGSGATTFNGNLGIGVSPTTLLDIKGDPSVLPHTYIRSTTTGRWVESQFDNGNNQLQLGVESSTPSTRMTGTLANGGYVGTYGSYGLTFHTNNQNRLTIDASGAATFNGAIGFKEGVWNISNADSAKRLFFQNNSTTYIAGNGSNPVQLRNASEQPLVSFNSNFETIFHSTGGGSSGSIYAGSATFTGPTQINGATGGASTYLQLLNNGSAIAILGSDTSISGGNAADVGLFVYGDNEFCLWANSTRMVRVSDSGSTFNGASTFTGNISAASGIAVSGKIQISNNGSSFGSTLSNGSSQFYNSSTSGLVIAGAGSTSDLTVTNKSGGDVFSIPAGTTNVAFAGNISAASGIAVSGKIQIANNGSSFGSTLSNGSSQFYNSSTAGLLIAGAGSTSDLTVTNKSGGDVFSIPTGTTNVDFAGAATFNGSVTSTSTGKLGDFTVATLPSAASNAGYEANVTDSSVTTFGSTVAGSGSSRVKVYSNGTNWTVQAA